MTRLLLLIVLLTHINSISSEVKERLFVVNASVVRPQSFLVERQYIASVNAEKFSILRRSSGTVDRIHVNPEQHVKAHELLVTLENRSQRASLEVAQKTYQSLEKKVERLKGLKKSQDVSKAQFEDAKRELLNALMNLENAKKALLDTEIRAPFAGYVGVPRVVIGETLKPDSAIISVREGAYTLTFLVPPSHLRELSLGQEVRVGDKKTSISAIERTIDPVTLSGFAKARFSSCADCIIGESVFAHVVIAKKEHALLVDRNAIFYEAGKPFVVAIKTNEKKEDRAEHRKVTLGLEQNGLTEILAGLEPNERIIANDPKRILQNALVKVVK